jgi:hypothetical protein
MLDILSRMHTRVARAAEDSDTALFYDLLMEGECVLKLITCATLALLEEDASRSIYRLKHRLVRADGLGEWTTVLREAVKGPAARLVVSGGTDHLKQLSQSVGKDSWQHAAVSRLDEALRILNVAHDPVPQVTDLLRWFELFTQLRNATRAHGATQPATCARLAVPVRESLRQLEQQFSLLQGEWVVLHRNLSGKYRVTAISEDAGSFGYLKSSRDSILSDGVYLWAGMPRAVPLIYTDPDLSDYLLPNGAFNERVFEAISYITDDRHKESATEFLLPVGTLPVSETQGVGALDAAGNTFANLPPRPTDYVSRRALEDELRDCLLDDRHSLITMAGRGGVGKTSTALQVLHGITATGPFDVIVWFSARDIDLLTSGPKPVSPHVLSEENIAAEFARLTRTGKTEEIAFKPKAYFEGCLQSPVFGPTLFVFDNFETVRSPRGIFMWLHTHLRLPNKILITTRFRDFNADYRVEVGGMTKDECDQLVDVTARRFGVESLLTDKYRETLYHESDGHPYVVKILLGRIAREKKLVPIERVMAAEEDVLDALFERTYTLLSPGARRVFLLLATWRSAVAEIALEAILLRPANERMSVKDSVDELMRSSLVESRIAETDGVQFLVLPLAAMLYGRRKLEVSPLKAAVEADKELLLLFGATSDRDLNLGLKPRVERFITAVAQRIDRGAGVLADYEDVIEFLARRHSPAWLLLADMLEERGGAGDWEKASQAIQSFLQRASDDKERAFAWERLEYLARRLSDGQLELAALVERASLPSVPLEVVSRAANRVNAILSDDPNTVDQDEMRILVTRLIDVCERRHLEMDGTDLSRLAWLHIRLKDYQRASEIVNQGLQADSNNRHLRNLQGRLKRSLGAAQ